MTFPTYFGLFDTTVYIPPISMTTAGFCSHSLVGVSRPNLNVIITLPTESYCPISLSGFNRSTPP